MKSICKPGCMHKVLRTNIVLGVILFSIAVYLIITGEYANLATRQQSEALLNALAIGGLLYSAFNWFLDLALNPQFRKTET